MKRRAVAGPTILILVAVGCVETDVDMNDPNRRGSNSDLDSDSDTDADSDADSDADTDTNHDTDTATNFEECVEVYEEADSEILPVDIIFAVDNSPSMDLETGFTQKNLNEFSAQIAGAGADAHIVLITSQSTAENGICVDPPLGSGSCPNDSNSPVYLHVGEKVNSHDPLKKIYDTYDQWKDLLRPVSKRHFIVISDDNSDYSADTFVDWMASVQPPIDEFTFHAITASNGWETNSVGMAIACLNNHPCCLLGYGKGFVYEELVEQTDGIWGDLCTQDFDPIFDAFAEAVGNTALACEWKLPEPPPGEQINPEEVNVDFIDEEDKTHHIGYVESQADCENVEHGWYYDQPSNPSKVYVCEQTCDWIQNQKSAKMNIILGCQTKPAAPI